MGPQVRCALLRLVMLLTDPGRVLHPDEPLVAPVSQPDSKPRSKKHKKAATGGAAVQTGADTMETVSEVQQLLALVFALWRTAETLEPSVWSGALLTITAQSLPVALCSELVDVLPVIQYDRGLLCFQSRLLFVCVWCGGRSWEEGGEKERWKYHTGG